MRRRHEGSTGRPLRRCVLALAGLLACGLADPARAAPPIDDGEGKQANPETRDHARPPNDGAPVGEDDDPTDEGERPPDGTELPAGEGEAPETATQWYARGIELAQAEDYRGAAEAFLRSFELKPTPEALYNAAFAFESAGEYVRAIELYEDFIAFVEPGSKQARDGQRAIQSLMPKVAVLKGLRFSPTRPPSRITVNGEAYSLDDFPLLLPPGAIVLEVGDELGEGEERYELMPGESLVVDLRALLPPVEREEPREIEPLPEGPSPEALAARERAEARFTRLKTSAWIGVGLSGAAAVGTVVLGSLTVVERDRFASVTCVDTGVCPGADDPNVPPPGDPEVHFDAFNRYRLGTNVMIGVSAGLATATLIVGVLAIRAKRQLEHGDASSRLRLRPSPAGLALEF